MMAMQLLSFIARVPNIFSYIYIYFFLKYCDLSEMWLSTTIFLSFGCVALFHMDADGKFTWRQHKNNKFSHL